jgi:hypothetical protein
MKKILLFVLLLLPVFSDAQEVKYFVELEVRISDPLNIPYYVKGKEITTLILEGIKTGKIKPFEPYSKKSITAAEVLSRTGTPSYTDQTDVYYVDPADLGFYIVQKIMLDTTAKKRRIEIDYLTLTIPADLPSNMKGIEMSVAGVKFDEVRSYLNENKAMWYNPRNNTDSMSMMDALISERYKFHGFILKDTKDKYLFSMIEEKRGLWADYNFFSGKVTDSLIIEKIRAGKLAPVLSFFEDYFQNMKGSNRVPKTLEVRPEIKNTYLKFTTKRWKLLDSTLSQPLRNSGDLALDDFKKGTLKLYGINNLDPIISTEGLTDQDLAQINIEEELVVTGPKQFSWKIKSIIYTSPDASEGQDVERFRIMYNDFIKWAPNALGEELAKFIEKDRFSNGSIVVKNIFQEYIAVNRDEHFCIPGINLTQAGFYKEDFYKNFEGTNTFVKRHCEEQLQYIYNFILNVPTESLIESSSLELALLLPENQTRISISNYNNLENPYPPFEKFKNLEEVSFSSMSISNFPEDLYKLEKLKYVTIMEWNELTLGNAFEQLSKVKSLRFLKITDMNYTDFPGIEKLKSVEEVEFAYNKTFDSDAAFIQLAQLPGLKKLNLYSCNLTVLNSSIGNLKNLEEIILSGDKISVLPKEIKKLKKLKKLTLDKDKFSDAEKLNNKKLLPKVEIAYL